MNDNMATWLSDVVNERGWSLRELARRAGISHTALIKIVNGDSTPTHYVCKGIARALNLSDVAVMEKAGLISPHPTDDPLLQEMNHHLGRLPEDERKLAIAVVRAMAEESERRD